MNISRGAAPGTAGTAVAVPEFPIISSVLGDTFHFVGKLTNLVGFYVSQQKRVGPFSSHSALFKAVSNEIQ